MPCDGATRDRPHAAGLASLLDAGSWQERARAISRGGPPTDRRRGLRPRAGGLQDVLEACRRLAQFITDGRGPRPLQLLLGSRPLIVGTTSAQVPRPFQKGAPPCSRDAHRCGHPGLIDSIGSHFLTNEGRRAERKHLPIRGRSITVEEDEAAHAKAVPVALRRAGRVGLPPRYQRVLARACRCAIALQQ